MECKSWLFVIIVCLLIVDSGWTQTVRTAKKRPSAKKTTTTKPTPTTTAPAADSTTASDTAKAVLTSAQVAVMTDEVLKQVSEIRGLKLLKPVKSGAKSRPQIEAMVIKTFNEEMTAEDFRVDGKTLELLGLAPKNFAYRDFMTKLLTEQIAGFYDPKTKEFHLADWNSLDMQKPVMAHELTHVLQDQHFNLLRFEKWPKDDGDREMAIHSLIEGDALAVMIDYLIRPMGRNITELPSAALTQMNAMMNSSDMPELKNAPNATREGLIFPYTQGMMFCYELVKAKGWEGVSEAYKTLPQSTEQVLHFSKYATNELPVKIALTDVAPVFGSDWQVTNKDTNGEFGYYLALAEYLDKAKAQQAAAGWGGDQYALFENKARTRATLAHVSAWDTANDAQEFFQAYSERTKKRYPNAAVKTDEKKFVATTPDGETYIELRGKNVVVIEGAPAGNTTKIAAQLWTSKIGD